MTEHLTVMTWNIQGEIDVADSRIQRQLDFLETHTTDIDIILFQAVNYGQSGSDAWDGQLGALLEYFSTREYHVAHTADWAKELKESNIQPHADIEAAHNRCNLIASQWPLKRQPLSLRNHGNRKPRELTYYTPQFPEKLLVAEIDISSCSSTVTNSLEIWNVGIVNGASWGEEKLNMLETVYGRVNLQTRKTDTPVILGGDFNAPKRETGAREIIPHGKNTPKYSKYPYYGDPHYLRDAGGEIEEFRFDQRWKLAESRIFNPNTGDWGMKDAYWTAQDSNQRSSVDDYTHIIENANPPRKRLDHILVSKHYDVSSCVIWNGEQSSVNGLAASDHAPVVANLTIA